MTNSEDELPYDLERHLYLNVEKISASRKYDASYFRERATGGDAEAQHHLAECYFHEFGVVRDFNEAAKWATLSANQNHADAMVFLAYLHGEGLGVPKNPKLEVYWTTRAAVQHSHPVALHNLAISHLYDHEGFAHNEQLGVMYLQSAISLKHTNSKVQLGLCYKRGIGVPKDEQRAEELFAEAFNEELKSPETCYSDLGDMYLHGCGTEVNIAKAIACFKTAVEKGDYYAEQMLKKLTRVIASVPIS